jgi:hypothetical protein
MPVPSFALPAPLVSFPIDNLIITFLTPYIYKKAVRNCAKMIINIRCGASAKD